MAGPVDSLTSSPVAGAGTSAALEVLALLKAAALERFDDSLDEAAVICRTPAPRTVQEITPKFEAYFAIATLIRAMANREPAEAIERRYDLALRLTEVWCGYIREVPAATRGARPI